MPDIQWTPIISGAAIFIAIFSVLFAIVRDRKDPFKARDISGMVRELSVEVSRQAIRIMELERLVGKSQDTILRLEEIVIRLSAQIRRLGYTPEVSMPELTSRVERHEPALLPIYEIMNSRFSPDELNDLAFRLDIKKEQLVGETHAARVQSFIEYASRHELLEKLIAVGKTVRPDIEWPDDL